MQVRMPRDGGPASAKGSKEVRPAGAPAPEVSAAAASAAADITGHEQGWVERLAKDPSQFVEVEREVHERMRQHSDRIVAALLAQASERPEMAGHVEQTMQAAKVPLRPVEKKDGR
jgi:hypothetical protein